MDSEDAIWREFLKGPLTLSQAVNRLEGMGYSREDAEDLVNEWADEAESEHDHD